MCEERVHKARPMNLPTSARPQFSMFYCSRRQIMTITIRVTVLFIALTAFATVGCEGCMGCSPPQSPGEWQRSEMPREQARQVERDAHRAHRVAEQELAFDLLATLEATEGTGNILFSPYAVASALAKIYAGAGGQTRQQIKEVLGVEDEEVLHAVYNELDHQFERQARQGDFVFHTIDALIADEGVELRGDYLDVLAVNYGAGVHTLDISGQPEQSRQSVNQWVAAHSNNRFPAHLPQGALVEPGMAVASAIYFHARWQYRFDPAHSDEASFRAADGTTVDIEMMQGKKPYRHFRDGRTRAAAMSYDGANVSFIAIKPATKEQDFKKWADEIDGAYFREIIDELGRPGKGEVALPKLKLEATTDLERHLSDLGLTSLFDADKADFSGLSDQDDLFVSHAAQEAVIEFDEHGGHGEFEQLEHRAGAVGQTMRFDRPFYFAVYDQATDTILLVGRIVEL